MQHKMALTLCFIVILNFLYSIYFLAVGTVDPLASSPLE